MGGDSHAFVYSSKPLGENEIRVIELQPSKADAVIRCNLITIKRDQSYKALSYSWGDVTPSHSILVNKKKFWIHKSLYEALHHIRDLEQPEARDQTSSSTIKVSKAALSVQNWIRKRAAIPSGPQLERLRLWTGRICINQENIPERNAQVEQMGETYARATEVLIWLGIAPLKATHLRDFAYFAQHHSTLSRADFISLWPSVVDVLSRAWFRRLWICQEIALAQSGTFLLGHERCSVEALFQFQKIHPVQLGVSLAIYDETTYDDVSAMHKWMNIQPHIACIKTLRELVRNEFGPGVTQGSLVGTCAHQLCKDPRDHIFGIIGIAKHISVKCQAVDYNLTTEELYRGVMRNELLDKPLFLAIVDQESTTGLPSWVSDFSKGKERIPLAFHIFSAGGSDMSLKLTPDSFSTDSCLLRLSCYALDTVLAVWKLWEPQGTEPDWSVVNEMREWKILDLEHRLISIRARSSPYGDYRGCLEAFWRTLIANTWISMCDGRNEPKEWQGEQNGAEYEVFVGRADSRLRPDYTIDYETSGDFTMQYASSLIVAIKRRSISVTNKGYFVLAPESIQQGDFVVVVPGLRIPFILRAGSTEDKYILLGTAYVHGIMHGEFVEQMTKTGVLPQILDIE